MTETPLIDRPEAEGAPPIVVLAGFMGSGKTSTGRALAELLRWEFVDLDEWVEREQQTSIRELFESVGEAGFREVERRAVQRVISECARPTVVALGGGTFAQSSNDEVFRRDGLRTVFLEVPLEIMLERCCPTGEQDQVRPLAADPEQFRRLYEARLPSYRRADITVEAGDESALEVARSVGAALALELIEDR
jgi:shikimate kinase